MELGVRPGFTPDPAVAKLVIGSSHLMEFRLRSEVETDTTWLQLIPYCVFVDDPGMVLAYNRGKSGGEDRLHSKVSIGIGGHINPVDASGEGCEYFAGLLREITEEIDVEPEMRIGDPVALIYDDSDAVGRVHLGIVHLVEIIGCATITPQEDSIVDPRLMFVERLVRMRDQMEGWSQLCIDYLAKQEAAA